MSIEEFPTYPNVSINAISVNPNREFSRQIDQIIFDLYDQSREKNGELTAYNQLVDFVENTSISRKKALDKLITADKWFKKGIEFIYKHHPYREKKNKEIKKVTTILKKYPEIQFEDFLKVYQNYSSLQLAYLIHYLDSNKEYFDSVTIVNIKKSAQELHQAIMEFDKVHLLLERSNDLVELVLKKLGVEDVKGSDFVRTLEQIKIEKKTKPGPKIPKKLLTDIEEVITNLITQKKELAGNWLF